MIEKVVKKFKLVDYESSRQNLAYWLSRPAAERVAAVDFLRKQYYGDTGGLQRVARVIKRPSG